MGRSIHLIVGMLLSTVGFLSAYGQDIQKIDSLNYALEISRTDTARVRYLVALSREYIQHDLAMSQQFALKAVELAESAKEESYIAMSLMELGTVFFYQGMLELAAKTYYRYLKIQRLRDDKSGIASGLTNLGGVKLQMMDFEASKKNLLEALEVFNELSIERGDTLPPRQITAIYNNLGIALQNMGEYNQAVDYYLRGISLSSRIDGDETILGNLYNNLASTYINMRRFEEAYKAIEQALLIRMEKNDKAGQAASYRMLGVYFFEQQLFSQALENFYKTWNMASEVGIVTLQSFAAEKFYQIYKATHQLDSALKYHEIYKELTDKINSEEALNELNRLELTARFEEQETLRQIAQKRRDARYRFIGIVMALVVIILGLLYFLSRSRMRRLNLENKNIQLITDNMQLEKESLEKELELKNKELTTNVMYQIRKNELINDVAQKLLKYSHQMRKENQEQVLGIVAELEKSQKDSVWEEFELRFHQVHNEFFDKINAINPDLSLNERRLCAFLRLNMTTKEIASITGQSQRSIEVARTRLRRKLDLTNSETGLIEFLSSL